MPPVAEHPGVGQRIRELRAVAGLSQQQLATAARLSVSIVSQLEQGQTADPKLSTLRALAKALGVTVGALIEESASEG